MSEDVEIAKAARDYCNNSGSFFFEYSDESNELIDAFEAGYEFAKNNKKLEKQLKETNKNLRLKDLDIEMYRGAILNISNYVDSKMNLKSWQE